MLRIIAMFLIVMHHYSLHGRFDFAGDITFDKVWIQLFSLGGKWGVDVFVLITGYFLINSTVSVQKILKLVLQISFYSIGCFLVFGLGCMEEAVSGRAIIRGALEAVLPIPYGLYWFATTYFVLYLLVPFLNPFIISLGQERHLKLLVLLTVIWSFFPTVFFADFDMNNVGWFVYLYLAASYIRLYPPEIVAKPKLAASIGIGSYLLIMLSVIVFDMLSLRFDAFADIATHFAGMNSILMLSSALFTFVAFLSLNFRNVWINTIASTTFGIYLLHDNVWVREFLWIRLFNNASYSGTPYLIAHSLAVSTVVFAVCSVVELLRIRYVEKPIFKTFKNGNGLLYRFYMYLSGAASDLYRKLSLKERR